MKRLLCEWQGVQNRSLPNLNVLKVNDVVVGFIYKPRNTKTDRNAWRIYRGVGDSAEFMCHNFSKTDAMATLNRIFAGNTKNIVFAEPVTSKSAWLANVADQWHKTLGHY
jgi:ribosomal protein RSM22 (predicted rRNA methylase)